MFLYEAAIAGVAYLDLGATTYLVSAFSLYRALAALTAGRWLALALLAAGLGLGLQADWVPDRPARDPGWAPGPGGRSPCAQLPGAMGPSRPGTWGGK